MEEESDGWGFSDLGLGSFLGVHPFLVVFLGVFFIGESLGVPSIFCVCVFCLGVCYVTFW